MSESNQLICVPGQRLCLSDDSTVSGEGTYDRHGYIYSLLSGVVKISEKDKVTIPVVILRKSYSLTDINEITIFLVYFIQMKIIEVKSLGSQTIVPVAGDIVTARISVLNQRFAKCAIISIGEVILRRVYRGVLRKEDVRAERKDEVEMYKSFRPGDIILARVVSVGLVPK